MQEFPLNLQLILRHAERLHPRKTVVTRTDAGYARVTFAELAERVRRLIAALGKLGVGPDDRVATFCWNHQQHVEAYLGVPCMGAVLHTLNIRLFEKDLAFIVDHAQDKVVIVDKSLFPVWEKIAARVDCVKATIVVDDAPGPAPAGTLDYETLLRESAPIRDLPAIPEDQAAAFCYTSGTTGHPKGVVYSHRSNVLHSFSLLGVDSFGISEKDVGLPIVPMFHANAWGLPYACLLAGSDLVLPGRFMQPAILTELFVERRVTFAAGVPSIWLAMLEPLKAVRPKLGHLTKIVCGGSAVPPALARAYRSDIGVPITQAWGMTETSPLASMCKPVSTLGEADLEGLLTSQGRIMPGVEVRIAGDDGKEVAWDGASVGELQVRGPWIAKGYWREEPTAEKFQDGWLRTGDVASICPQGYIRIADRTKDLVKSGGEWISSVELEGHIMGHPKVAEAAVIAIAHPRWSERPLACVVPRKEARGSLTKEEILDWLRPRVARWWLPDDVVFIDEVPKTSVGKFDKKVLRARFKDHVLPA
jgi:fatty-acyl-CoA synthase